MHNSLPERKIFAVYNWPFWVGVALLVKGVQFFATIFGAHYSDIPGTWAVFGGDAISYLQPVENLINNDAYTPDDRMPGYGAVYLFFRLFFDKANAVDCVVLAQYILDAVTVYVLALAAHKLFKSRFVFLGVYGVALVSFHSSVYSSLFLTESFTVSATILMFYFLVLFEEKQQPKYLLVAGAFWAWIVFLRPVFLPIGALVVGLWGVQWLLKRHTFQRFAKMSLFFLLPFLIVDTAWIVRNYPIHKRIVPLAPVFWYASSYESGMVNLLAFIQSFGGGFIAPSSVINWFGVASIQMQNGIYVSGPPDTSIVLPTDIYTSKFSEDSLLKLRAILNVAWGAKTDSLTKATYQRALRDKLATYTASIREEKPFLYYVKAPLRHTLLFFDYKNSWYSGGLFEVPPESPQLSGKKIYYLKYAVKQLCAALYYAILIFGVIGIVLIALQNTWRMSHFVALASLYSIVIFPVVLRMPEPRYFLPAYPLMIVCGVFAVWQIKLKFEPKKGH